jgi:hypothetical protein
MYLYIKRDERRKKIFNKNNKKILIVCSWDYYNKNKYFFNESAQFVLYGKKNSNYKYYKYVNKYNIGKNIYFLYDNEWWVSVIE